MFAVTFTIFAVVVAVVIGHTAYGLWVLGVDCYYGWVEAVAFKAAAAEAKAWASAHLYDSEADAAEWEVQVIVEDALTACLTCGEQACQQKPGEQTLSCACMNCGLLDGCGTCGYLTCCCVSVD